MIGTVSTPHKYSEFFSVVMVTCLELDVVFFSEEALERDNFLSPEEAKEFGLIDRVLSRPPDNTNNRDST